MAFFTTNQTNVKYQVFKDGELLFHSRFTQIFLNPGLISYLHDDNSECTTISPSTPIELEEGSSRIKIEIPVITIVPTYCTYEIETGRPSTAEILLQDLQVAAGHRRQEIDAHGHGGGHGGCGCGCLAGLTALLEPIQQVTSLLTNCLETMTGNLVRETYTSRGNNYESGRQGYGYGSGRADVNKNGQQDNDQENFQLYDNLSELDDIESTKADAGTGSPSHSSLTVPNFADDAGHVSIGIVVEKVEGEGEEEGGDDVDLQQEQYVTPKSPATGGEGDGEGRKVEQVRQTPKRRLSDEESDETRQRRNGRKVERTSRRPIRYPSPSDEESDKRRDGRIVDLFEIDLRSISNRSRSIGGRKVERVSRRPRRRLSADEEESDETQQRRQRHHRNDNNSASAHRHSSHSHSSATRNTDVAEEYQLYVGNLPQDFTEGDMRSKFGVFGPISKIRIIKRNISTPVNSYLRNNCPAFGFVVYEQEDSLLTALKCKENITIDLENGRSRKLDIARGKTGKSRRQRRSE